MKHLWILGLLAISACSMTGEPASTSPAQGLSKQALTAAASVTPTNAQQLLQQQSASLTLSAAIQLCGSIKTGGTVGQEAIKLVMMVGGFIPDPELSRITQQCPEAAAVGGCPQQTQQALNAWCSSLGY